MRAASAAMRRRASDVEPGAQDAWDKLDQLAGAGVDLTRAVQTKTDVQGATSRYTLRASAVQTSLNSILGG
jgi:hypothetical protein